MEMAPRIVPRPMQVFCFLNSCFLAPWNGPTLWRQLSLLDSVGPEATCVLGIESLRNRHFLHPQALGTTHRLLSLTQQLMLSSGKPYQAGIGTVYEPGEPSADPFSLLMEVLVPHLWLSLL